MAFDMFAGEIHEAITQSEEVIFELAYKDQKRFPDLLHIWNSYYKDPKLSSSQAGQLAIELSDLLVGNGGNANPSLAASIKRLASFFKAAHLGNQEIRCQSD